METDNTIPNHSQLFKNSGKSFESLRKDRNQKTVELRRDKREDMIQKKRNEMAPLPDKTAIRAQITTLESALKLIQDCACVSPEVAYPAILNIRLYLSMENVQFIDELLSNKLVDVLVKRLAANEISDIRFNAAWALTNIASGSSEHTSYLVNEEVIRALCALLVDQNATLVEQGIWALSNIMGDGAAARAFVLRMNILPILGQTLSMHFNSLQVMRQFSWMLINICRKKETEIPIEYVSNVVPLILAILDYKDEGVLSDALWSVTHLADSSQNHISIMINAGIVDKVFMFFNATTKLAICALRSVGNVAASVDDHTQYLLDHGLYVHLQPLLFTTNQKIKKEVYWLLSNIAAGTRDQMKTIFTLNMFPQIIQDLESADYPVRREAAWVISNVIHSSTFEEAQPFIESKILYFMKSFLESQEPSMVLIILEVILILLRLYSDVNKREYICAKIEESGVLDMIENLQTHQNKQIHKFCIHILNTYFSDELDEFEEEVSITENKSNLNDQSHAQYDF